MNLPVPGRITQFFGPTNEKLDSGAFGFPHFNKGIDIAADEGTPIANIVKGTVIWVGDANDGWGVSVKVKLDDGRIVSYGHMQQDSPTVRIGQRLNGGEIIGKVGSTGASTGPHLSFDVLGPDGNPVDPSDIVGFNAKIDNRTGQPWGGSGGGQALSGNVQGFLFPKPNPEVLKALKDRRDQLWRLIQQLTGKEDEQSKNDLMTAVSDWQEIVQQIDVYERTGYFNMADAMTAFSNAIQLGSLDLSKAAQLFTEWQNKEAVARNAAEAQIKAAQDYNTWADAKRKETTYGYNWRPDITMLPASFEDAYEKWKRKVGVGEPPSSEGVDLLKYLPDGSVTSADTVPYSGPDLNKKRTVSSIEDILALQSPFLAEFVRMFRESAKGKQEEYPGLWGKIPFGKVAYNVIAGAEGKKVPGERTWDEKALYDFGRFSNWLHMQALDKGGALLDAAKGSFSDKEGWKRPAFDPNNPNRQSAEKTATFYLNVGGRNVPIQYPVSTKDQRSYPEQYWGKDNMHNWWELQTESSRRKAEEAKKKEESKKKKPWWKKLPGLAAGGINVPPGMYAVGEQGPETVVGPSGEMAVVGQEGPQVAQFNQPGFDVLPADVPPEQAYLYAKFKRIAQEDAATSEAKQLMEQQERASDPALEQKVKEAIVRAVVSILAANPPPTPVLVGPGWDRDPWADLRPLSGIGPDGKPINQSTGLPLMDGGMPQVPGVPGAAPGIQMKGGANVGVPNVPVV